MPDKKITLKDIAAHLGVNTSTVSRALNPKTQKLITPEQVKRIKEAADELGYVQNSMAYALKKGCSMTIGVIVPDLMNPVFPPILKGIMNYVGKEFYASNIAYCENDVDVALAEIKRMRGRQVDGFILASAFKDDCSVKYCVENSIPAVTVGRAVDEDIVDRVVVDNESGIKQAIQHLIDLGHQRIALVAAPQRISDGYERYHAYCKEVVEKKLGLDERLVVFAEAFNQDAGRLAMQKLLDSKVPFTGVIAANDLVALGCIDALESNNLRCPEDVSVIGFNNMPYLDYFKTPLTTIDIRRQKMGELAAKALIDRIRNPSMPIKHFVLEPGLVIRKSTTRARQV